MQQKTILIADDEHNIRLTLSRVVEDLGYHVLFAATGDEVMQTLASRPADIVFMDLKMPGISGMELLRRVRDAAPSSVVVVISAYGTVSIAVEAIKLGAIDFVEKPFSPAEIRSIIDQIERRTRLQETEFHDYDYHIAMAKKCITKREYATAEIEAKAAVGLDPLLPEAFNILGVLSELRGEVLQAQKYYHAAIDVDPTFSPARKNLDRATQWNKEGTFIVSEDM